MSLCIYIAVGTHSQSYRVMYFSRYRVECGGEFSVLVTDNGILMTCGCGHHGVQGHRDDTSDCLKPKLVEDLITHDVIQVV